MSRHSKKNKENGLNDRSHNGGEAAAESRFSHFVDGEDSYKPFAEMKELKPRAIPAKAVPSSNAVLKTSSSGQTKRGGSDRGATSSTPASSKSSRKNVVGGYDPAVDFGDILRQWEATGDPYAMPGRHAGNGPGVGRRLKKGKETEAVRKLEDTTQAARKAVRSMDFAQIFAQWEADKAGVGSKKACGDAKGVSGKAPGVVSQSKVVSTGPRKDFAEILAEWEASQAGKYVVSSNVLKKTAEKPVRQAIGDTKASAGKNEASVAPSADIADMADESSYEAPVVDDGRPKPVWSAGKPTRFGSDRISGGGGFADIYDRWAAEQRQEEESRLEQAVAEKEPETKAFPQIELSKLRQMLPQVTLDLHGLTAEEASRSVRDFLQDSHRNGLRKVCVIHGKGLHAPQGQGVLKDVVLQEIDRSKLVREFATPSARYGGSGVLWLILKA